MFGYVLPFEPYHAHGTKEILYINSLGLPVRDVTFCCIIIFYVSAAEPAIGKSIFVWNWHPRETRLISTQLSVRP
jgi:hypothetical protein